MLTGTTFQIQPIPRALFQVGGLSKLPKQLKGVRAKRAFIVGDPGVAKAGLLERTRGVLVDAGIETATFDAVSPNPTAAEVLLGAEALSGFGEAAVVAVGGGSAMDAAKTMALMAPNRAEASQCQPGARLSRAGLPVIAVPTTAGTGSETNMYGVITDADAGRKFLTGHASVMPASVLLDPELTVLLPKVPTATCGMDVLTHAVEAYTSSRTNPFAESIAYRAIQMVAGHLVRAFEDGADLEARGQMLLAAHLAGDAFSSAGLGVCHAMGHPLSARLGAAHGQTLATLLPAVMRFNLPACERKYAEIAGALAVSESGASDADNAARAILEVERLRAKVQTDQSLTELGGAPSMIPAWVEDAFMDPLMTTTPRMPTAADVTRLYEAAL